MEFNRAALAIGIALAIIVVVNLVLYYSLTRRNPGTPFEMLGKASHHVREPWGEENNNLQELSRRVADLKAQAPESAPTKDPEKPG